MQERHQILGFFVTTLFYHLKPHPFYQTHHEMFIITYQYHALEVGNSEPLAHHHSIIRAALGITTPAFRSESAFFEPHSTVA